MLSATLRMKFRREGQSSGQSLEQHHQDGRWRIVPPLTLIQTILLTCKRPDHHAADNGGRHSTVKTRAILKRSLCCNQLPESIQKALHVASRRAFENADGRRPLRLELTPDGGNSISTIALSSKRRRPMQMTSSRQSANASVHTEPFLVASLSEAKMA